MTPRWGMLQEASALVAAATSGLLAALLEGGGSAPGLAERLGLDVRAVGLLLEVLEAQGLAVRDGEGLRASPGLAAWAEGWPGGLGHELTLWAHLPRFLATGEPLLRMDADPADREAADRGVVDGLATLWAEEARHLAAVLDLPVRRVLDVGCGSGVWGLALAERRPGAVVAGLDLPAVLERFAARAEALGIAAERIPGDMHAASVPAGAFDAVVVANVLRLESPERAAALLRRLAPAVAPGGTVVVVDALGGGTPEADTSRAVYALHLALRTSGGRVHPPEAIAGWLEDAGFSDVRRVPIPSRIPLGALVGRCPPSSR